ncbi:MAG: translation initiation factor 2 [Pseudomonadota bacterium]
MNFRILHTALALGICASITGCATVVRGTTEVVTINYSPADAKVTTSLNHTCQASPCLITVSRKEAFTVRATKPGYDEQVVAVRTKVSGKGAAGIAGNVLLGGVVGIGVDAATGATKDHYPNPVNIQLLPEGSAKKPEIAPARKPAKKSAPTS